MTLPSIIRAWKAVKKHGNDGLPEVNSEAGEFYGMERMEPGCEWGTLPSVKAGLDGFVSGAKQFDDLTMLRPEYPGPENVGTGPETLDSCPPSLPASDRDWLTMETYKHSRSS